MVRFQCLFEKRFELDDSTFLLKPFENKINAMKRLILEFVRIEQSLRIMYEENSQTEQMKFWRNIRNQGTEKCIVARSIFTK